MLLHCLVGVSRNASGKDKLSQGVHWWLTIIIIIIAIIIAIIIIIIIITITIIIIIIIIIIFICYFCLLNG